MEVGSLPNINILMKIPFILFPLTLLLLDSCKKSIPVPAPQAIVSTYAGNGYAGLIDSTAFASTFYTPIALTVDGSGNLYVADQMNNVIREITQAGIVSIYAGTGIPDENNGPADSATFSEPAGVVIDPTSGNIYVADASTNIIREIAFSGIVSTYEGNGLRGFNGAPLTAEFNLQINNPVGMVVDGSGNLYEADALNMVIRKITTAGSEITYAGNGTEGYTDGAAASAQFSGPTGLAIDLSGNLYVADLNNNVIRKITLSGEVSTLAGNGTKGYKDGADSSAEFDEPTGLAVDDSGNVYVCDRSNNVIRKINTDGVVSTFAGNGIQGYKDGGALSSEFNYPSQITMDASGNFYITDQQNNLIRKITPP